MSHFLKHLALFLLPLIVFFTPATVILFYAGEFYPPQMLGELARGSSRIIVGAAYNNIRSDYQLQETILRQPEVIALGTSRVGGFRAEFFKDPAIFYNDTGTGGVLSNFRHFIEATAVHPPKIIIAGMDAYFFNPEEVAKNNVVERPNPFLTHVP
ncbi:MAG: Uncharacterized protein G01um101456_494, partial [Parcubacteria group bacterium Gr01-1014_56]